MRSTNWRALSTKWYGGRLCPISWCAPAPPPPLFGVSCCLEQSMSPVVFDYDLALSWRVFVYAASDFVFWCGLIWISISVAVLILMLMLCPSALATILHLGGNGSVDCNFGCSSRSVAQGFQNQMKSFSVCVSFCSRDPRPTRRGGNRAYLTVVFLMTASIEVYEAFENLEHRGNRKTCKRGRRWKRGIAGQLALLDRSWKKRNWMGWLGWLDWLDWLAMHTSPSRAGWLARVM